MRHVAAAKLNRRGVRSSLISGSEIKTTLLRVEENGIIVNSNRATRQWASGKEEARVPRDLVSSVQFAGKVGRKGMIGGLISLGVGAAITGAAAAARRGKLRRLHMFVCAGIYPLGCSRWLYLRSRR
jgi:hypothetical protein